MDLGHSTPLIAGAVLTALFVAIAGWEAARPGWAPRTAAGPRWLANLSIFALGEGVVLALTPWLAALALPVAMPLWPMPAGAAAMMLHGAVILLGLDLAHYLMHRALHASPWGWRLHQIHHTDLDLDLTTAVRHHPLELALVLAVVGVAARLIGATPTEVAVYGVLAFGTQMLAHANVTLPPGLQRALGGIVVTPAFHRLHHSRDARECHANFGEVLVVWDRLLGTVARAVPGAPIVFGTIEPLAPRFQRLGWMLLQPVLRQSAGAAERPLR